MKIVIDTNGNFGPEVNGTMGLFARDLEHAEVLAIRAHPAWKRHDEIFEDGLYEEETIEVDVNVPAKVGG